MKQPAAILAVRRFVEASMKAIPQNDEPRSSCKSDYKNCECILEEAIVKILVTAIKWSVSLCLEHIYVFNFIIYTHITELLNLNWRTIMIG